MKKTMYNQKVRRVCSILLALAIVCGFFPSGGVIFKAKAQDALSGVAISYNFITKTPTWSNPLTQDSKDVRGITYADTYDNWEYYGVGPNDWAHDDNNDTAALDMYTADPYLLRIFTDVNNNWAAMKINISKAGLYRTSIDYAVNAKSAGGTKGSVYILPMMPLTDVTSALNTATSLGMLDCAGTHASGYLYKTTGADGITALSDINIPTAGEYLFVVKQTYRYADFINLVNLQLDGTELSEISYSVDENMLGVGESISSKVTGTYGSGKPADLSKATIQYVSSAPNVASVDAATGQITTVSQGEADIAVSVTLNNVTMSKSVKISVSDAYAVDRIELTGSDSIAVGSKMQLGINAIMKDGSTQALPYSTASVSIVASEPADVITLQTDGGVIGNMLGTAGLVATAQYHGKDFTSGIFNVTVKAQSPLSGAAISYNFRWKAYAGDTVKNVETYTDYSDTRPWAFVAHTCSGKNSAGYPVNMDGNEMQALSQTTDEWLALKVKIPAKGRYNADFTYRGRSITAIVDTFIMPIFADMNKDTIAAKLISGNKISTIDTYYPEAQNKIYTSTLGMLDIPEAGEYLLVFRAAGKNNDSKNYFMLPVGFSLDGTELSEISYSVDENMLGVGESTSSAVTGTYSSGKPADLSKATFQYVSSAPNVASVDAVTGQITTVSQGEADITVSVALETVTLSQSVKISVSDEYAVDRIELTGSDSIAVGSKMQLGINAVLKNGSTQALPYSAASVSIVASEPADVITLQADGSINGNVLGTAGLVATAQYHGKDFTSGIFTVTVKEQEKSSSVINYVFTGQAGDPRELTRYGNKNWAYAADTLTSDLSAQISSCLQIISDTNEWFALKIKIPEAGKYNAKFEHRGIKGAGYTSIFLMPMKEQTVSYINNNLTSAYFVAKINGYSATETVMTKELGNIYVPAAGEYLLVLRSDGKAPGSEVQNMYPRQLTLEGEVVLGSVDASLEGGATEIEIGHTASIHCSMKSINGDELNSEESGMSILYSSSAPNIASVDEKGVITAKAIGKVEIGIIAELNGATAVKNLTINISDYAEVNTVELTGNEYVWVRGTLQLEPIAHLVNGNSVPVPASEMTYTVVSCEPEGAATIDENGLVSGIKAGSIRIKGTTNFRGKQWETNEIQVAVNNSSKKRSTIWTEEKREIVRENAQKYSWAKNEVKAVVADADIYVNQAEKLWNMVVPEGLPRDRVAAQREDPGAFTCRYCGEDLRAKYGNYSWIINPLQDPWKIQCPACKRRFPSNDFGGYYQSGLDEHGIFNKELAKQNGSQYLTNDLYPEKGEGWGVDDGFGYFPGITLSNGVVERHSYIALYIHDGLWYSSNKNGFITDAIDKLARAYAYTGEAKYGRTGAILLDRVADFYPDYDWYRWSSFRGGENYRGKISDPVWECWISTVFAQSYDALFPVYDDPQVIAFLSQKASRYKMESSKDSAAAIRTNAEDGILREINNAVLKGKIAGNFGMTQTALTSAAIALDTMPETEEWLNWLMRAGEQNSTGDPELSPPCTGGNILPKLVNVVGRDGNGNEAAPGYNALWISQLLDVAEMLYQYDAVHINLYENPKFTKMYTSQIPLTLASYYTVQVGDSSGAASRTLIPLMSKHIDESILGFKRLGTPLLAQFIYWGNGNSVKGIHLPITERNPEDIQNKILETIDTHGQFTPESDMQTGYGFAVLRDGVKYDSVGINLDVNNLRDFWIYFGRGCGHGHKDGLDLGIDAYGLNMAPDLGYPEDTGTQPNRIQWVRSTLSHNTVMVNGKEQTGLEIHGTPMHFDDSGRVKVMDINAPEVYSTTDIYRRTVLMVKVNDDVSYGVDFFRVRGGSDHIYSFHSQSDEIFETEGLDLIAQADQNSNYIGTYAGADVPWGPDPKTIYTSFSTSYLKYPPGFTWLYDVRRDISPEKQIAVDFKVKDFRKILPNTLNLHLRMTMLNDFKLSVLAITRGKPPQVAGTADNIDHFEYVLARRTGTDLDTLFTTVYEPYKDTRYLKSMTDVSAEPVDGTPDNDDTVKAVRITHTNGRVDYVIYATNNKVKYRVDDLFEFRGFVGVYTLQSKDVVYSYVNDGDLIGNNMGNLSAYTGTVEDFTRELALKNTITVKIDQPIDMAQLVDKYIYIDNIASPENGAYRILGATAAQDGNTVLDVGDVTLVRAFRDSDDLAKGYLYNISSGQKFRIPLNAMADSSPVFTPVGAKTVDAQSEISFTVSATSPAVKTLTYQAVKLPRGASFDPSSCVFRWTPDSKQLGHNHVSIEVSDGVLSSTLHIDIQVLGSTNGELSGDTSKEENDDDDNVVKPPAVQQPVVQPQPPVSQETVQEGFIDLTGYDWAKKEITELAKAGIIKGISENTFAPGKNITRADFSILLVRAFKLTDSGSGNFNDVPEDVYYANDLATAKASGIISGYDDNCFKPAANISREDMLLIMYRAMQKAGVSMEAASDTDLAQFADADQISGYAKTAVAAMAKNGFIKGNNNMLNPKGHTTRAEVAVLLYRILYKQA